MSCIHGKDTKPEEIVRKYLFSKGFRYRKNDKKASGKPGCCVTEVQNSYIREWMFLAWA